MYSCHSSLMGQTVRHWAFVSIDAYQTPTYSASYTDISCRIVYSNVMTKDATGKEVISKVQIYLADTPAITTKDKIQYTDYTGATATPKIISVEAVPDGEGNLYYQKVYT